MLCLMSGARKLIAELGLTKVRSHIQSGNIFFVTMATDRAALTGKIEQHLFAALGYEVPVFLRTAAEVERALQLAPFNGIEATPDRRFIITFISQPLPASLKLPFVSPKHDFELLHATEGKVFSLMRLLDDRPGNPAAFLEKTCKLTTTSRFFATTGKILQAAQSV